MTVDHHQLVEAIDQGIGRRHRRALAAHRHLVEHRNFGLRQPEHLAGIRRLRLRQFHLAKDGADDQDFGVAADLFADVFPAPAFLALDVEQLFGEVGSFHVSSPVNPSLDVN
jgi:hypothetical protein